ncbi:taste receptor type 2 member 125-like [Microtus ochrogaster]|uniref:Taste receptor type 2 n=1 Tax=Microtus ochrogaster TaxID=79684 RepID=A0ABM0LMW3_MICOH|nr:taste receptor type 2 member 125-like [Microtus ochrogaster]
MGDLIQSLSVAILFAEFIFGISANGFIAVVNIMDLVKRRNISSVDQIITALAICRFTEFSFVIIIAYLYNVWSDLLIRENMIKIITVLLTVSNHFNVWLATCLSIFYFLKIGNFFNSIFLYLKWRVNKVVPVILLASLVLLFSNIIATNIQLDAWFDGFKSNMSFSSILENSVQLSKIILLTKYIFTFIPLTVSLMTFFLLSTSLWRHLKIMQLNARESRHASTTAHIRALQTVTAFLLLYAVVLLLFFVLISRFEILERRMLLFYHQIIGCAHPSVHSCVLILADNKLRQASLKVLWWLRGKPQNTQRLGS